MCTLKNSSIEGAIRLSTIDSLEFERKVTFGILRVMHGASETSENKGEVIPADYQLLDFVFSDENTFSFTSARYFYENTECTWNHNDFIQGKYVKQRKK